MARQNIDDEWWSDPRRTRLAIALGSEFMADGVAVNAWRLAQHFWVPDRKPIPVKTWQDAGIPQVFIDVKLADLIDGFVYVRGTEERNAWLFAKIEAGRRGGLARVIRASNAQAELSTSKQIQPSSSSSFSVSSSDSDSISKTLAPTSRSRAPVGAVDELRGLNFATEKLGSVKQSVQRLWLEAYPDRAWIRQELLKACAWIEANPRKQSKDFGRFMNNWLAKGWEQHRKTIPSQPALAAPNARMLEIERQVAESREKTREAQAEIDRVFGELEDQFRKEGA